MADRSPEAHRLATREQREARRRHMVRLRRMRRLAAREFHTVTPLVRIVSGVFPPPGGAADAVRERAYAAIRERAYG